MFAYSSRFVPDLANLFLETRKRFQKSKKPDKVSWVRNTVRVIPAFWKLSTMEERRKDLSCLFRRGDHRNNGHDSEKLSWVRVPVNLFSVAQKLSTIEECARNKIVCFSEEIWN
jgi:hypothetical protein